MKIAIHKLAHMISTIKQHPTDSNQQLNVVIPEDFEPTYSKEETTKIQSYITLTAEKRRKGNSTWYVWCIDVNQR